MKQLILLLVIGLSLACSDKDKPKSWIVVCDKNGLYSFTEEDGERYTAGGPRGDGVFLSFEEAKSYRDSIKEIREERKKRKETKWEDCDNCTPTPTPTVSPSVGGMQVSKGITGQLFGPITVTVPTSSAPIVSGSYYPYPTPSRVGVDDEYFAIRVNEKGYIKISFKDGSVTMKDCKPNDAAKQFWREVIKLQRNWE